MGKNSCPREGGLVKRSSDPCAATPGGRTCGVGGLQLGGVLCFAMARANYCTAQKRKRDFPAVQLVSEINQKLRVS